VKKSLLAASAALLLLLSFAPPAQAAGETASQKFSCKVRGTATFDPVVVPDGGPSAHEHLFAGNPFPLKGVHTYDEMVTAVAPEQGCNFPGDTAAYWVPTLRLRDGSLVRATVIIYYDQIANQTLTAFPPDLGMVWGANRGLFSSKSRTYYGWNCSNRQPLQPTYEHVDCSGFSAPENQVTLRTFAPYCWDGTTPPAGTRDYGSRITYPVNYPTNLICPAGSKVLPRIRLNYNFRLLKVPAGAVFSSDAMHGEAFGASAHADFWNTWDQAALEGLVRQLNA
jgi:hypothetical protein